MTSLLLDHHVIDTAVRQWHIRVGLHDFGVSYARGVVQKFLQPLDFEVCLRAEILALRIPQCRVLLKHAVSKPNGQFLKLETSCETTV